MPTSDDDLLYSSALFTDDEQDLTQAQRAKMARLCDQLALNPGDHLLEIGTGWGALAEYAARHYGCRVTTMSELMNDNTPSIPVKILLTQ